MQELEILAARVKEAASVLANTSTVMKNKALENIAAQLIQNKDQIIQANCLDMENARKAGMSESMQDRLLLTEARIQGIAESVLQVVALEDPVGEIVKGYTTPSGLMIQQKRVPLGVIAIIYEARPNVTADAAVLCLKAGNAVILRGGKEAIHSNKAIADIMRTAIQEAGLPIDCIGFVEDIRRESANKLMTLRGYVDVLIPRGGAGLIRAVVENSKVPVIETGWGNCHVYIDDSADLQMGAQIIYNAKCSRPSVCNAAETLLVSRKIAKEFLPMAKELLDRKNTEIRGDAETAEILGDCVKTATEEDYATEFGDYILAVKIVDGIDEAIKHINKYSSGHSEAIVTSNVFHAGRFQSEVDAAAVYVNASTRFTDGGEFGLGAEIGISTQKMHARGPMGLKELTTGKYIITGTGQVR